jgi:hypothetical protein
LKEEGLAGVAFETILAEAVFCGNALLTVGGSTPYNAVYGRVPRILPSIDQVAAPDEGHQPEVGLIQHTHRLREISIQAMVEGSARARLGRAMNTRTTLPAQRLNLQVGEEVDFYKEPASKDVSGWYGPATVIDVSRITRGIVSVKLQKGIMEVQTQNIQRHLHFLVFLANHNLGPPTKIWEVISVAVDKLVPSCVLHVGSVYRQGHWIPAAANKHHYELLNAVRFFAENHLHIRNVIAARFGRGVRELSSLPGYSGAITLGWSPSEDTFAFLNRIRMTIRAYLISNYIVNGMIGHLSVFFNY